MNEKIKLLRQNNGLTQAQMAEKLDLSINAYGAIERGETKVMSENLENILQKFEMDLLEFLSIGENGVICLISNNKNNGNKNNGIRHVKNIGHLVINAKNDNAVVYANHDDNLKDELRHLKNKISHQDSLMEELQSKLNDLGDIISLLKKQQNQK